MTTGATMRECAKTLKRAGAECVVAVSLAAQRRMALEMGMISTAEKIMEGERLTAFLETTDGHRAKVSYLPMGVSTSSMPGMWTIWRRPGTWGVL